MSNGEIQCPMMVLAYPEQQRCRLAVRCKDVIDHAAHGHRLETVEEAGRREVARILGLSEAEVYVFWTADPQPKIMLVGKRYSGATALEWVALERAGLPMAEFGVAEPNVTDSCVLEDGKARMISAIQAFTAEAPNDEPNGVAERELLDLRCALDVGSLWKARHHFRGLCAALADDTQALRIAAESFFGGDFRATLRRGWKNWRPEPATAKALRMFEEAWATKEAEGYRYGSDALEQVRLGWEMCSAEKPSAPLEPVDNGELDAIKKSINEALMSITAHLGRVPNASECMAMEAYLRSLHR